MNVYRRFGFGGASSCHVIERMVVGWFINYSIWQGKSSPEIAFSFRVMVSYGELLEVINWLHPGKLT